MGNLKNNFMLTIEHEKSKSESILGLVGVNFNNFLWLGVRTKLVNQAFEIMMGQNILKLEKIKPRVPLTVDFGVRFDLSDQGERYKYSALCKATNTCIVNPKLLPVDNKVCFPRVLTLTGRVSILSHLFKLK